MDLRPGHEGGAFADAAQRSATPSRACQGVLALHPGEAILSFCLVVSRSASPFYWCVGWSCEHNTPGSGGPALPVQTTFCQPTSSRRDSDGDAPEGAPQPGRKRPVISEANGI